VVALQETWIRTSKFFRLCNMPRRGDSAMATRSGLRSSKNTNTTPSGDSSISMSISPMPGKGKGKRKGKGKGKGKGKSKGKARAAVERVVAMDVETVDLTGEEFEEDIAVVVIRDDDEEAAIEAAVRKEFPEIELNVARYMMRESLAQSVSDDIFCGGCLCARLTASCSPLLVQGPSHEDPLQKVLASFRATMSEHSRLEEATRSLLQRQSVRIIMVEAGGGREPPKDYTFSATMGAHVTANDLGLVSVESKSKQADWTCSPMDHESEYTLADAVTYARVPESEQDVGRIVLFHGTSYQHLMNVIGKGVAAQWRVHDGHRLLHVGGPQRGQGVSDEASG
jgi:hypothetical protein